MPTYSLKITQLRAKILTKCFSSDTVLRTIIITMIVNFMCHGVSRLNIITGCVWKGVARWVSIWIGGLCEVAHRPQCGRVSSNPFRVRTEQSLLFSCLTTELGHLTSSSPALGLRFTPSIPVVLRDLGLNYITGFPGSPVYKQKFVGLSASILTGAIPS